MFFRFTSIPLLCSSALKKKSPLAIGSLGTGRRRTGGRDRPGVGGGQPVGGLGSISTLGRVGAAAGEEARRRR
jgi:hypothetical protein